ncbi:MAG: chitobiase/beta-hexosaminidase C-terminal domain-containing protein [Bacteroidales bacterium]|nr:chitobiase/beta-hexosaminidase C-terminal domain-containing protein [Bacteroidales bacterium]
MKKEEMKQKITCIKAGLLAIVLITGASSMAWGQNVLYEENMGFPSANTPVQYYKGWQDTLVIYTGDGTCDIRSSSASTGYGGASGGGNVMINDTAKWFQISGINTSAAVNTTVKLYFGLRKTTSENGSHLLVEFSTDSIIWVSLEMADTLPTGTGTSGWHRVCFPNLPVHPHLHLRFSSAANVDFRIDDIRITDGDEIVLETVATPTCSPSAGTYYEPQNVILECSTPNTTIRYTLDGSTPTGLSPIYSEPLTISSNCKLKAFAESENMYNSGILSAQFTIIDTNSVVTLPFDISENSELGKEEVKTMPGFREVKLGASYADGSAKFESKNAGQATLTAHLDSAPEYLEFDIKGTKGGTPSSYSGILFVVSESADGIQWSTVATLDETDINTESYTHQGSYTLSQETRYIRWFLATASSGNTQLNNIVISKRQQSDESGIDEPGDNPSPDPYPNPAETSFQWNICEEGLTVQLYDMSGHMVKEWTTVQPGDHLDINDLSSGCYLLKATTRLGRITKKIIVK